MQSIFYAGTVAEHLQNTRPEDTHDVRETYRLIVDPNVSASVPESQLIWLSS